MNEAHDSTQHFDVPVRPNAEVLRTDAAFGKNRRCFSKYQPGATDGATAQMDKCQSFAKPSTLEYSHIGETNTRLANFTSRIASGSNRLGMVTGQ